MKILRLIKAAIIPLWGLIFLLTTGCCKPKQMNYEPVRNTGINVGVLLSLTGSGSSSGESSQAALQLARTDIQNWFSTLHIPLGLTLFVEDTRTDTAMALQKLKTLYSQGIRWVIGPYSSAELAHIKPFADQHGILVISPSSVAVSLAIPGDNVFRFVTSDRIQGEAMTALLTNDTIRQLIPMVRDDVWGNDLLQATASDFTAQGGSVSDPVKFNVTGNDLAEAVTRLDNAVGEALEGYAPSEVGVYMLSFSEGTQILKAAQGKENLKKVRWYGGSAFAQNSTVLTDTAASGFASSHGLPCPVYGLDESARYIWEPLRARITGMIGHPPDVYALTAYDALWVVVRTALALGPDIKIERMKQFFIDEADHYYGASGNTRLDVAGDRAEGNYDFWALNPFPGGVEWKRIAWYNSATGTLVRLPQVLK